jgi:hypothetical protein
MVIRRATGSNVVSIPTKRKYGRIKGTILMVNDKVLLFDIFLV